MNKSIFFFIFPLLISSCLLQQVAGNFSDAPEALWTSVSPGAKRLIEKAFVGVEIGTIEDHHVHVVGLGTGGSGAFVHPNLQSWTHPLRKAKFNVYANAAGIRNLEQADQEYVTRLLRLIQSSRLQGKFHILAFDKNYTPDGSFNQEHTEFYIPNDYVFRLAEQHPEHFIPVISVNPYRKDAIAALEKWGKRGVGMVKWLPNAMGIDPADPSLLSYYRTMKKYGMVLLSHTGEEQAVEAEQAQALGNPLRLRFPLEQGLKVVMAHSASLGLCEDQDDSQKGNVPCFDLFLRMMDNPRYEGLLFGETSALSQFNRVPEPLTTLLSRKDLHHRLINGSDYPLPAINIIIRTRSLAQEGFITDEEREYLNEIYHYNPLLFDFVVKRTLRHPKTGQKFDVSVFDGLP